MPKTMYQCERCKKVYETKQDAANCEKSHVYAVEFISQRYGELLDRKTKFPSSITCKMSDGREIKFYRKESDAI